MNNTKTSRVSFFRSMRGKLLVAFLTMALIPLVVIAFLSYGQARDALRTAAFHQLEAVTSVKEQWVTDYLEEAGYTDVHSLANVADALREEGFDRLEAITELKANTLVRQFEEWGEDITEAAHDDDLGPAIVSLSTALDEQGASEVQALYQGQPELADAGDGSAFTTVHTPLHSSYSDYVRIHELNDLFLIDMDGNVVYSVEKCELFGSSLPDDFADLNLTGLYTELVGAPAGTTVLADLQQTHEDEMAMFIGSPVYSGTVQVGMLAFQLPFEPINTIIQERHGMGETGETYLVGSVNGISSYRSDRIIKSGQIGDPRSDAYTEAALAGESNMAIQIGSTGDLEFTVYRPLDIPGLNWAIFSTQTVEEIIAPQRVGEDLDLLAEYAAVYGYYDIFLIDSSGYIFYTVVREADYETNLVDGPYSDTNLGQLIQEVIATQEPGMADFAMYAPSNEPAAFAAYPIVYNNEIELIVAAQLPTEGINAIMQERTGMGDTGETVLVGPDYRMRSDSYLDDTGHSIEASLSGTVDENGMDIEPARRALDNDESGVMETTGYLGDDIVAAYAPLTVGDLEWGIVAKQSAPETFAAIDGLTTMLLIFTGIAAIVVSIVAIWIASTIARPVVEITDVSQSVASGNLDRTADINTKDEVGQLARAFNQMVAQLREMLRGEQEQRERQERIVQKYVEYMAQVAQGNMALEMEIDSDNFDDPLVILGMGLNETTAAVRDMLAQIRESASNVSAAAAEIQAATTQQASGASEQSASISQTTTTVDEVRAISEQTIERTQEVVDTSQRTVEVSRSGQQAVQDSIESMTQIKERVESIAENILGLSEQTQQVGEIVASVNEIATQSNMLALNASVEAARAGEHGKGFAVVAAEVRTLAEQSKQATDQVRSILTDIQEGITGTVMATEEGIKVVDLGVDLVAQMQEVIDQLSTTIDEFAQTAMQVMAGGQQQASGVEQISLAMQNINQATMQSMASTRQAEKAAQDLNKLANDLNNMVAQFTI